MGTFINLDAWCFWNTDDLGRMTKRGLKEDIDFYIAGGGVDALVFNMNFQRTFFDSRAWTPYGKDVELREDGSLWLRGRRVTSPGGAVIHNERTYARMYRALAEMKRNCPDYMRVRCDYCREHGVEYWHSMRMDDVHWTSPGLEERPQHSDFWRANKERMTRAWYRRPWFPEWHWSNYALDYGRPEVYDYNLALVREYLLDYESDGLELDWLRSIPVFRPGADEAGTPVLTRFMRDVRDIAREAAAKWGHPVRIGIRVPARVQEALDLGMDVPAWAEEGLVDLVVPGPNSVRVEQDTQIALWRRLLPAHVLLAPSADMYAASGDMQRTDLAIDCGFASAFFHAGADFVYCFNHFRSFTDVFTDMQAFFPLAADRAGVSRQARRHVLTWRETAVEGAFAESPFPSAIAPGSAAALRFNLGEQVSGRTAHLIFGMTHPVSTEVWLNATKCPSPRSIPAPHGYPPPVEGRPVSYYVVDLPVCLPHDGWNVVDFANTGDAPILQGEFVWMDIAIDKVTDAAVAKTPASSRVVFGNRQISIDGAKFRLLAGTMHYFRVPRASWRDRMEKAKELGLNAIETYLCWNLHERREDSFDFTDNLDLEAYCRLAQELGLKIVLRPGPYICSEWDLGGLPSWLMVRKGIRFRRANAPYLTAVDRWFDVLLPKIRALDYDHGGPIIAIQIENEYGSYGADKAYLTHLRDRYRAAGIRVPLFTADGAEAQNLEGHIGQLCVSGGCLPDVAVCYNFLHDVAGVSAFQRRLRPDEPLICAEFWCGWFNVWGQPAQKIETEVVVRELESLLAEDGNVIFYALCGGTDFYWTNGANGDLARDFRPMTTSYDFDALLTEDGQITEKFRAVQAVLAKWQDREPQTVKRSNSQTVKPSKSLVVPLSGTVKLFDCLDAVASKKVSSNSPLSFEELGTDFGYVFYRSHIQPPVADPITAPLSLRRVRDRAHVFIDGKPLCVYYRTDESAVTPEMTVGADGAEVGLLVENMGRINFSGPVGLDFKGVCQDVAFAHQVLTDWEMWCLPLDNPDTPALRFGAPDSEATVPAFHLFAFGLEDEPADTFLRFPGAHGLVWLNGRPLGRYWDIGPDNTLYVPASWLRRGPNRLIAFESERLDAPSTVFVSSRAHLV